MDHVVEIQEAFRNARKVTAAELAPGEVFTPFGRQVELVRVRHSGRSVTTTREDGVTDHWRAGDTLTIIPRGDA